MRPLANFWSSIASYFRDLRNGIPPLLEPAAAYGMEMPESEPERISSDRFLLDIARCLKEVAPATSAVYTEEELHVNLPMYELRTPGMSGFSSHTPEKTSNYDLKIEHTPDAPLDFRLEIPRIPRTLTGEERRIINNNYLNGLPAGMIARRFKTNTNSVYQVAASFKPFMPYTYQWNRRLAETTGELPAIEEMILNGRGKSASELIKDIKSATGFEMSRSTVYRMKKKLTERSVAA